MTEQQYGAVERERIMQEKIDEARRWARRLYKKNQELKKAIDLLTNPSGEDVSLVWDREAGLIGIIGESWQVDNE